MRRGEVVAGVLSLAAGGIHGLVSPEHFSEWWAYGLFFAAAALAQVVFGLLVLTRGVNQEGGLQWSDVRGKVFLAGIVGNLLIMALWLVTRTVGVPAGPAAGEVEDVGGLDAVSKVLEAALVAVLAGLWWAGRPTPAGPVR